MQYLMLFQHVIRRWSIPKSFVSLNYKVIRSKLDLNFNIRQKQRAQGSQNVSRCSSKCNGRRNSKKQKELLPQKAQCVLMGSPFHSLFQASSSFPFPLEFTLLIEMEHLRLTAIFCKAMSLKASTKVPGNLCFFFCYFKNVTCCSQEF